MAIAPYTSAGGSFITLVTHDRQPPFDGIVIDEMHLNNFGAIAREKWFRPPWNPSICRDHGSCRGL